MAVRPQVLTAKLQSFLEGNFAALPFRGAPADR